MTHVNLVIATPGHSVMTSYLKSLLSTIDELAKNKISWAFTSEYSSHVADAREQTLSNGGPNDVSEQRPFKGDITYDKILWIDSDINWTPQDVLKLYHSDKDIVSGAYLLANGEVTAYRELFKPGMTYDEVIELKEPLRVDAVGMGFLMVKSGVFESLSRPWFQSPIADLEFNGKKYSIPILGEDLSFCKRVKDAGFDIWLDPSVKLIHNKMMRLTWEGARP
jgi:hypothetical protein